MKYYTGIGSRETPYQQTLLMTEFAKAASDRGWILRTGGADGADSAFAIGSSQIELYIPWDNFNGVSTTTHRAFLPSSQSSEVATLVHPYYQTMKPQNKLLIDRNIHQVLGQDLSIPTKFVICWTPDGCESHTTYRPETTGGTGVAISLASRLEIPVFNINHSSRLWDAFLYMVNS